MSQNSQIVFLVTWDHDKELLHTGLDRNESYVQAGIIFPLVGAAIYDAIVIGFGVVIVIALYHMIPSICLQVDSNRLQPSESERGGREKTECGRGYKWGGGFEWTGGSKLSGDALLRHRIVT